MRFCARCDNCRFVCGPILTSLGMVRACGCGAPGDPCPVCNNRIYENNELELSEDFIVDIKREDR